MDPIGAIEILNKSNATKKWNEYHACFGEQMWWICGQEKHIQHQAKRQVLKEKNIEYITTSNQWFVLEYLMSI